jgi:phage-Barnase-EndoU-ColicinE5/D-RelE like nuclease3
MPTHKEFQTITELIDYALQEDYTLRIQNAVCRLCSVPLFMQQIIMESTGINVADYRFLIDDSAVRHILKRHGRAEQEQLQGQVAIVPEDIAQLVQWLLIPERVSPGLIQQKDTKCLELLVFDSGWQITIILEVRTGRKVLCPVTMYKRKGQPQ